MKANRIILSTVLLLITLLVIEVTLRVFTPFPIHAHRANKTDDNILSYRLDQSLGGIDDNGFRNASVPETADIVAIGDSHTYGVNVDPEDSWPNQLAAMTNMSIYNFGVSGYGILQYKHLIHEATKLKPRYIIIGFYAANDLKVCKLFGSLDYWKEWAKEKEYDIEFCPSKNKKERFLLSKYAMYETAIGSLTTYVWELASQRYNLGAEGQSVIINHGSNPTITTGDRLINQYRNMDLTRQEASLGFEITKDVLIEAKNRLDKLDIELIVMFIPSKESVYLDFPEDSDFQPPREFYDMVAKENDVLDKLTTTLNDHDIDYINAKPYVSDAVKQSKRVYTYTGDGHPLKAGYEAYAKAVYESSFASQ